MESWLKPNATTNSSIHKDIQAERPAGEVGAA